MNSACKAAIASLIPSLMYDVFFKKLLCLDNIVYHILEMYFRTAGQTKGVLSSLVLTLAKLYCIFYQSATSAKRTTLHSCYTSLLTLCFHLFCLNMFTRMPSSFRLHSPAQYRILPQYYPPFCFLSLLSHPLFPPPLFLSVLNLLFFFSVLAGRL